MGLPVELITTSSFTARFVRDVADLLSSVYGLERVSTALSPATADGALAVAKQ
jgi:hypothetical protein